MAAEKLGDGAGAAARWLLEHGANRVQARRWHGAASCASQILRRYSSRVELCREPRQATDVIARPRRVRGDLGRAPSEEVRQHEPVVHRDDDVLRPHVAVRDAAPVRVNERGTDCPHDVVRLTDVETLG